MGALSAETKFWLSLSAFAQVAQYLLSTGAPLAEAEEILFGRQLPSSLPLHYACLTGGMAYQH